MKNFSALTVAAGLAFSSCSKTTEDTADSAGESIVLTVDCTAEALTGGESTASGEDFLYSIGQLVTLGSSVDLRIRDDVGWMNFLLPYDWNPHGVNIDMMLARFQADGVILMGEPLSDAEFVKKIDQYATTAEMLDAQGLIVVDAGQDAGIGDCLKYFRVIYDAGIDQLIFPHTGRNDSTDQTPRVLQKVPKTVP